MVTISTFSLGGLGLRLIAEGGSSGGGNDGGGSGGGVRGDNTPSIPPPPKFGGGGGGGGRRGGRGGGGGGRGGYRGGGGRGGGVTTTTPAQEAEKKIKSAIDSYAQAIEKAQMELEAGVISEVDVKKRTLQAEESLWKAYNDAFRLTSDPKYAAAHEQYATAQEESAAKIKALNDEIETTVASQKAADKAAKELAAAEKKLASAQEKLATAQEEALNARSLKEKYAADKKLATATENVASAQAEVDKLKSPVQVPVVPLATKLWDQLPFDVKKQIGDIVVPVSYSEENMATFVSKLKADISKADIGSELFKNLNAQLADVTTLSNIISIALQKGIDMADINPQELWRKIFGGENIPDETWQSIEEAINEKLKELKLEPIKIDVNTGQVTKDADDMTDSWKKAASAIQTVGGAMQQIENPAAKVIGTIAQAIATLTLSYAEAAKSPAVTGTGWGWIGFAAAGIATLVSTVSTIKSINKFAEGGMVKGNTYSNDQIPIMANAGEIVLNRAAQGNIASQLTASQSNSGGNPYVTGEMIYMGLTSYLRRTGRGEIMTAKR